MQALQFSVTVPQWLVLKAVGLIWPRAFYQGPLASIKLVDLPEVELPSEEWLKIETLMCGFCASDLNLILLKDSPTASPFTSFPCIIGHEICGTVAQTGAQVDHLQPGDRVCVAPALNCAARQIHPPCPACRQGIPANCENYAQGKLAPGMFIGICRDTAGGFAPYFTAHQSQLFKLPREISAETGILIEPLSVGLQAVFTNMPAPGERILIIGAGVIGSMVLKSIRALDIDCEVTVAEPASHAAQQARRAGADHIISDNDILGNCVRITAAHRYKPMIGRDILMGGFQRIYDTVGSSQTLNLALRSLAAGGTLSQVGIWHDVKLDLTPLWLKGQTLKGIYGCGYAMYKDRLTHMFAIALDLVASGKVDLSGMVTHTFTLNQYQEMIAVNLNKSRHGAVKTAVKFF